MINLDIGQEVWYIENFAKELVFSAKVVSYGKDVAFVLNESIICNEVLSFPREDLFSTKESAENCLKKFNNSPTIKEPNQITLCKRGHGWVIAQNLNTLFTTYLHSNRQWLNYAYWWDSKEDALKFLYSSESIEEFVILEEVTTTKQTRIKKKFEIS
jgi:hypothetical protein